MPKYKTFSSSIEVEEWSEFNYTEEERHLLDVKKNAASPLIDYKGNYYAKINQLIRDGKEKLQNTYAIEGMQACLRSFRISEDIMAFRYVDIKELLIILWKTNRGRSYIYPQFLSSTLLKDTFSMDYLKKGRFLINLQIPKGSFGALLPEVNPKFPEFEVLLPYRMQIRRIRWNLYKVEND